MKLIDFAKEYGYAFIPYETVKLVPELYQYQEDILKDFDENNLLAIWKSRQMGLTYLESIYIAHFLLFNKDEENTILLKCPNSYSSRNTLDKVRDILSYYAKKNGIELIYVLNNKGNILLSNSNKIRIVISSNSVGSIKVVVDPFRLITHQEKPHTLIVDEAAYVEDLEDFIKYYTLGNSYRIKIFLISTDCSKINHFYDEIYKGDNSVFKKIKCKWNLNPRFNNDWYENIKLILRDADTVKLEVDLEEIDKKIVFKNKDKVLNLRIENEVFDKIGSKLLDTKLTMSEYIRGLIEKDLNS